MSDPVQQLTGRQVGGGGRMGYRYRARIERRVKRGRDQWRFVGEYHFMGWADSGPGLIGRTRCRWSSDRDKVLRQAHRWLDSKDECRNDVEGYA